MKLILYTSTQMDPYSYYPRNSRKKQQQSQQQQSQQQPQEDENDLLHSIDLEDEQKSDVSDVSDNPGNTSSLPLEKRISQYMKRKFHMKDVYNIGIPDEYYDEPTDDI